MMATGARFSKMRKHIAETNTTGKNTKDIRISRTISRGTKLFRETKLSRETKLCRETRLNKSPLGTKSLSRISLNNKGSTKKKET